MEKLLRRIGASKGETREYPVNPRKARYDGVPVARVGNHQPSNWYLNNGVWSPDRKYFDELVANYDPTWFVGTINHDHDGWWGGEAFGLVTGLRAEGEGENAVLLADLANLDDDLADEIDGGKWPHRSIEWWDAEAMLQLFLVWYCEAGDPAPDIEDFKFYDKFDRYFTGLAVLGLNWPAVVGLGPWPSRAGNDTQLSQLPAACKQLGLAAAQQTDDNPAGLPRIFSLTPRQEDPPMPGDPAKAKTPPEQGGTDDNAVQAENEKLKAELAASKKREEELSSQIATSEQEGVAATQAAIDAAVAPVKAQLLATQRDTAVKAKLQAHLHSGRLTVPAQRSAYLELAASLHGQGPAEITQADGTTAKCEKSPLQLLDEIVNGFPAQATIGQIAGDEDPGMSDSDKGAHATQRSEALKKLSEKNTGGES